MSVLIAGVILLVSVLALFHLKDRTNRLWIARLAYSRLIAQLTVLGVALIVVGALLVLDSAFENLFT